MKNSFYSLSYFMRTHNKKIAQIWNRILLRFKCWKILFAKFVAHEEILTPITLLIKLKFYLSHSNSKLFLLNLHSTHCWNGGWINGFFKFNSRETSESKHKIIISTHDFPINVLNCIFLTLTALLSAYTNAIFEFCFWLR